MYCLPGPSALGPGKLYMLFTLYCYIVHVFHGYGEASALDQATLSVVGHYATICTIV